MTESWNNWRTASIGFVVVMVALLAAFFETDQQQEERIASEMRAEERRADDYLNDIGHPNAKVSETQAFSTCRSALTRLARDPETAVVPNVGWMKGGVDWRFFWNAKTRMVRMKNGLGLEVAATAACVVDEQFGDVKLLLLDGKEYIGPNTQLPTRLVHTRP